MARPRSDSGQGVTLFPFMSILACLIGTIVMMICIVSIVQAEHMGGRPKKEIQWAMEFVELEKKIAVLLENKKLLMEKAEAHGQGTKELTDLEAKIAEAERLLRDASSADQISKELQAKQTTLAASLEKLAAEKTPLQTEIETLKKTIASRKKLPEELAAPLIIQPDNLGLLKEQPNPYFIEVGGGAVLLHQDQGAKVKLDMNALDSDPAYAAFVTKAAADPKAILIFLLREDGWEPYVRSAYWVESKFPNLKKGKIPLVGKGAVDLGKFYKPLKR